MFFSKTSMSALSRGSIFRSFIMKRNLFIQAENTPNVDSVKFKPGTKVMTGTGSMEFRNLKEARKSPLAFKLFQIQGTSSVLFGPDFITVTKSTDAEWQHLKPSIFSVIMDFFSAGQSQPLIEDESEAVPSDTAILPDDSEVVQMIKELIDLRIRPVIQEDGGDIDYKGFDEKSGIVKLMLRGACRTCSSSAITLKQGIENMLMHYIPEVKGVEQVLDELDRVSQKAFEELENNKGK